MIQYRKNIRFIRTITIVLFIFFIASYFMEQTYGLTVNPSEIYISSQEKLQNGNYKEAIKLLKTLNYYCPFSNYIQQSKLDIIYAYYKSANLPLALATIDKFIRDNPNYENIDYVLYMRGLTAQGLYSNSNVFYDFLGINITDCDPQYAILAFKSFKQLIIFYPNSFYVTDAIKRLFFLKERLAKYELEIIKYYYQHNAYVAVINCSEQMLKYYPDTQSVRKALTYMKIAYSKLGLIHEQNKVIELLLANNIPIQ